MNRAQTRRLLRQATPFTQHVAKEAYISKKKLTKHTHIHMYVYIFIYTHMHICLCASTSRLVGKYIYIYIYVYIHVHTYAYIHPRHTLSAYIYIYKYMYIYIYICISIYIYLYIYTHRYICNTTHISVVSESDFASPAALSRHDHATPTNTNPTCVEEDMALHPTFWWIPGTSGMFFF